MKALFVALALAGSVVSSCSQDGSSGAESASTASTASASSGEIDSAEATPVDINVSDAVIPPDPQAPADEFAVGNATPRDPKGRPFLEQGDEGDDVAAMQARLIALGYALDDSGVFDDATLASVLTFQRAQQLVADGVVGTKTWAALDSPRPPAPPTTTTAVPRTTTTAPSRPTTTTIPASGAATGDGASMPSLAPPSNDPANNSKVDRAVVTLADQRVRLYDGDRVVSVYPVSSGRNGLTPQGTFRVQSKSPRTVSNSDSSISMRWMTRFNGGIGFHGIPVKAGTPLATPLGERPVSAGCIRMADNDAKSVFDRLPIGATVVVR